MNIIIKSVQTGENIVYIKDAPNDPFELGKVIQVHTEGFSEWRLVEMTKKVYVMDEEGNASHKGVWVNYKAVRV